MEQAKSILNQVACSLAIAEQELMFEHRDLHWGNILVKPTEEQTLSYTVNDEMFEIPSHGVQATIIDFTLSRLMKGMFLHIIFCETKRECVLSCR
jgi:serine/threonine-protein kinase haspin